MLRYRDRITRRFKQFKNHPLTRNQYYQTCVRYIFYNILLRVLKRFEYKWFYGLKFFVKRGDAGIVGNIYYGLYEYKESLFLLHVLRKEDSFLDIGANLGHFSLLISGLNSCRTIAIEPVPDTFEQLKSNIELNHLENYIETFNIGLGLTDSEMNFSTDQGTMNRVVPANYKNSVRTRVTSLDNFIKGKDVPFAIKLDAEGYEKYILEGGQRLLKAPELQVVIVELNEQSSYYDIELKEILRLLRESGFQGYDYNPFLRELVTLETYNKDQFNSIFIKNVDLINQKIKLSRKIKIGNQVF